MTETPGDPRAILDRPARRPDNVLRYAAHEDGVIDMYGSGEAAGALVVLLHGGFWQQEYDRMHLRPLAAALAQKGLLVALPEFRRVREPGSAWPAIFDDVASACQFVAGPGGTAPRLPVVLAGHSAGGHLALWAAAQDAVGPVAGVVALAPVADLAYAAALHLEDDAVVRLLGGAEADVPERWARADPMRLLPLGAPVEIVHGSRDHQVPVAVSERYATAATRAGGDVHLTVLPGIGHFELIDPAHPVFTTVRAALRALLDRPAVR